MHKEGLVLKSTGSWYRVKTEAGELDCRIRGKIRLKGMRSTNPVAVGDRVMVDDESTEEGRGVITELLDRKNYIVRRSVNLSKHSQIIAANLDQAMLIATLKQPQTQIPFIDRFAVSAEAYDIPFTLVFNKIDLLDAALQEELEYLSIVYRQAGYTVLHCSATEGTGLESLKEQLKGKSTLLSGHSGVGKSSLVNAIAPDLNLKTQKISEAHQQGQHTTTFAEMHALPFEGYLIDTPGIRGFGLVDMEPSEIGHYFPEIFELSQQCKFNNCLHLNEPGCAVKKAAENHQLAPTRYESYLQLISGDPDEEPYRKDQHHS